MKKGMMTLVMFLTLPMFAELSGNFTFSSNYIWRGMTQTMDDPGYSGGFDYSHESGFYAGTWGSNVAFGGAGLELDTYAGFTGTFEGVIDYDIGYIDYAYPGTTGDFEEFYISASYEGMGFSYYEPLEGDANYMEAFYSDDYVSISYGDYNGYGTNFLVAYAFPLFSYDASVGYSDFSAEEGSEMEDEDSVFFTLGASF